MMFFFFGIYFLIRRKFPYVYKANVGWILLAAFLLFIYNCALYTQYLKFVPLAAVGGTTNGISIVLSVFCLCTCLRIRPSYSAVGGAALAFLGLSLVTYSVMYPVFQGTDIKLCNQTTDQNVSESPLDLADVFIHEDLGDRTASSLNFSLAGTIQNDPVQKFVNLSFTQLLRSSSTMKGTLAIILSTVPETAILILMTGPLQNEDSVAANFWIGFITTVISCFICWMFEEAIFPVFKQDIWKFFLHGITFGLLSLTKAMSSKYIIRTIYGVIVAIDVPIMVAIEFFVIPFCYSNHEFEVAGTFVVFVAGLFLPITEYFCGTRDEFYNQ